jgi:gamma-glutamylcyclotransferase
MRITLERSDSAIYYNVRTGAGDLLGSLRVSAPAQTTVSVFAYGSNMLSARLRERAPSARVVSTGKLIGYELRWHKRSRDGSGKCSVTETGQPNNLVWGVVFEMRSEEKADLDRVEGLGQGYGERKVQVIIPDGRLPAMVYFATSINPGARPYDWYRELVVGGAREHRLPEDYIRGLESVGIIKDLDESRSAMNRRFLVGSADEH